MVTSARQGSVLHVRVCGFETVRFMKRVGWRWQSCSERWWVSTGTRLRARIRVASCGGEQAIQVRSLPPFAFGCRCWEQTVQVRHRRHRLRRERHTCESCQHGNPTEWQALTANLKRCGRARSAQAENRCTAHHWHYEASSNVGRYICSAIRMRAFFIKTRHGNTRQPGDRRAPAQAVSVAAAVAAAAAAAVQASVAAGMPRCCAARATRDELFAGTRPPGTPAGCHLPRTRTLTRGTDRRRCRPG